MSLVPISSLPPESRVWCYGTSDKPSEAIVPSLRTALEAFLRTWTAHRAELRAGFDWIHDRFLVIAVDESATGASGCSIDALTTQVRQLEALGGIDILDSSPVWYRDDTGTIGRMTRDEFRAASAAGVVGSQTQVFDLTVDRLEDVTSGRWEVAAGQSWHATLL